VNIYTKLIIVSTISSPHAPHQRSQVYYYSFYFIYSSLSLKNKTKLQHNQSRRGHTTISTNNKCLMSRTMLINNQETSSIASHIFQCISTLVCLMYGMSDRVQIHHKQSSNMLQKSPSSKTPLHIFFKRVNHHICRFT